MTNKQSDIFFGDFSDAELWLTFKSGNKSAYEIIYRRHIILLLNYGLKFIKDQEVIEDTVQDLFLNLWEKKEGLSEVDNIKRYLLRSLRNNLLRNKAVLLDKSISLDDEYHFDFTLSVEDKIVSNDSKEDQIKFLNEAFKKLSPREREALYLKFHSDLSYAEISELMSISEQSIYNLISRGLKKLQKEIPDNLYCIFLLYILLKNG